MIEQGEVRLIYKPVYWLLSQIFQMSLDQKYQFSLLFDEHIEKLDIKWKKHLQSIKKHVIKLWQQYSYRKERSVLMEITLNSGVASTSK